MIAKHVEIARDKVQVKMEGGEGVSTLAIDIEIPALCSPNSRPDGHFLPTLRQLCA